jgi:hypothetical protein
VQSTLAFAGPHVALALGQGVPASWPLQPLTLHERGRGRVPYTPLGGPVDYLVLRAEALPQLRSAVAHAGYGPMAVAFACSEAVFAQGGLVAHRDTHGLDASAGQPPTAREREQEKLGAWSALLADRALAAPGLRGPARLVAVTALGALLGARRSLRSGRPADLPAHETASALLRGYAAALPGRDRSRTP